MAAPDVYMQELYRAGWGTPLWEPDCTDINPGDVGFFEDHHFVRLFNATLPKSHPAQTLGVPDDFVPMIVPPHLRLGPRWYFGPQIMRSDSVEQYDVGVDLNAGDMVPAGVGFNFRCASRRGAVLVLKQWATREDLSNTRRFRDYIRQHVDSWYEFAERHDFTFPNRRSIFMVRGCDKTSEWALAALEGRATTQGAEVFFSGGYIATAGVRVSLQGSWGHCVSGQHRSGPRLDAVTPLQNIAASSQPADVPETSRRFNQPIFLRTWMIGRRPLGLPCSIKAAAGPQDFDYENTRDGFNSLREIVASSSDDEMVVEPNSRIEPANHPLDVLVEYILENSTAELAIVGDDDLYGLFQEGLMPEITTAVLERVAPPLNIDDNLVGTIIKAKSIKAESTKLDAASILDGGSNFLWASTSVLQNHPAHSPEPKKEETCRKCGVHVLSGDPYCSEECAIQPAHANEEGGIVSFKLVPSSTYKPRSGWPAKETHEVAPLKQVNQPGRVARPKGKRGPSRKACAECRRLKLKCNGQVPCDQCLKRGYNSSCPEGTQTTGQGHRLFWSTTSELRSKMSDMSERIRTLEEALKASHRLASTSDHSLLTDDLMKIREYGSEPVDTATGLSTSESTLVEVNSRTGVIEDAFGSLSVSQSGQTRYFGHAANSWWFMHNEAEEESAARSGMDARLAKVYENLPHEILAISGTFPFTLATHPFAQRPQGLLALLHQYLPSPEYATELRDHYFRYAVFMFRPIPRDEFDVGIYATIYGPTAPGAVPGTAHEPLAIHRLAVLFMVLAIGSLVAPNLPPYNLQAEQYHQLARATLFSSQIIEQPTVEAIQALHLMLVYMTFNEHSSTSNTGNLRWSMVGLIIKLSQTMGLHCDPERFNLDLYEIQRRRLLFCELYTYDIGQALQFSRPPTIAGAYFDVKAHFPEDLTWERSFHAWKYKFSECLNLVHIQAYSAIPPSYATVMDLNSQMEAFPIFGFPAYGPSGNATAEIIMQRHMSKSIKQEVLLYLHRGFFAKATSEHREDPLKSPYGTSVLAAYRSAYSIVELCRQLLQQLQHPILRIWFLWSNIFSSAVILGALVVRCPHLTFAPEAMSQLDAASDLFSRIAVGFSAQKVYDKIVRLQKKARESLLAFHEGEPRANSVSRASKNASEDEDDLLAPLGQKTRLIERSWGSTDPLPGGAEPIVRLPLSAAQSYHPNVLEYLRALPPSVVGVDTAMLASPATSVTPEGTQPWPTPPPERPHTPLDPMAYAHPLPGAHPTYVEQQQQRQQHGHYVAPHQPSSGYDASFVPQTYVPFNERGVAATVPSTSMQHMYRAPVQEWYTLMDQLYES